MIASENRSSCPVDMKSWALSAWSRARARYRYRCRVLEFFVDVDLIIDVDNTDNGNGLGLEGALERSPLQWVFHLC